MTWKCGSKGQFFVKWTIWTKRHQNDHSIIWKIWKNEWYEHSFVYLKPLLTVYNCKNDPLFIKISSFKIVNTKSVAIFQFRAKDTCHCENRRFCFPDAVFIQTVKTNILHVHSIIYILCPYKHDKEVFLFLLLFLNSVSIFNF